ncbi:hypothetical protein WA026_012912 [Henosepilachna vigintioctopunctata]|uniref:WW domain-containing protein n=1 Tax=Henosepilachna vigintioctopunctata TaxID=420089 RepID=A0AAW1TT91_9CUCU
MSFENVLPAGWEVKFDSKLGKNYYINHNEKTTSWDPPYKNKRSAVNTLSYGKQTNGTSKHITSVGELIPLQDFNSKTRGSPLTVRPKVQDSSLTVLTDTDEAVCKISAMFPTVSEAHIRLLMKNCRYMKSIFPQAEETIILDVLSNNDNSIQKSSDKLRDMGFEKKDTSKIIQQKTQSPITSNEDRQCAYPKPVVSIPKIKTSEEKAKAKVDLQNEYVDIPERLILIALETVDFDKEKASSLLKSYSQQESSKIEEGKVFGESELDNTSIPENKQIMLPPSHSKQSLKSLLKSDRNDKEKPLFNRVIEDCSSGFRSSNLSNTKGANPELSKGNNEKLLLEDYVKWQGPNSSLRKGSQKDLAKGPNSANLLERHIRACGPNLDFHKGPNKSVVKGSIFQQMKAVATIGEESRGK